MTESKRNEADHRLADEHTATASEIVRNFGEWQDRARQQPVYILHHGKPRLVLSSVQLMEKLCRPHATARAGRGECDLIDNLAEPVILLDCDFHVERLNVAARRYFGTNEGAAADRAIALVLGTPYGALFDRIARHVRASGMVETVELEGDDDAVRALRVTVTPHADGAAIIAEDVSARRQFDRVQASLAASDAALNAVGGIAESQINLRGFIAQPSETMATLTGLDRATLASVRMTGLFDIASRSRVGEAIETVLTGGASTAIDADILVEGTRKLPVRLGLAPLRRHLSVIGAKAIVVAQD